MRRIAVGRSAGRALLAAAVLVSAGCATRPATEVVPPIEPRLLEAGRLELPAGCTPVRGRVYRTRATVESDGRVSGAVTESGPGCVQEALVQWVESFRYGALDARADVAIDWIGVEAGRGG